MATEQYLAHLAWDSSLGEAQKIEILNEGSLAYFGYCATNCKGTNDKRWIIKRMTDDGAMQSYTFANGEKHKFTCVWDERANYDYKLTPYANAE